MKKDLYHYFDRCIEDHGAEAFHYCREHSYRLYKEKEND